MKKNRKGLALDVNLCDRAGKNKRVISRAEHNYTRSYYRKESAAVTAVTHKLEIPNL